MVCFALFAFTMEQTKLYVKASKEISSTDEEQDSDDNEENSEEDPSEDFEFQPKLVEFFDAKIITYYDLSDFTTRTHNYNDPIPESIVIILPANPPESC